MPQPETTGNESARPGRRGPLSVEEVGGASGAAIERIEVDAAGRVVVHLAGRDEPVTDARVARCFPWSLAEQYVSVLDAEGNEIALLETLEGLDETSRAVVDAQLAGHIFNPVIRRVISLRHEFGITEIRAETDRGLVTFQIRSRDDVRTLSATRALFRDADGNVYELPDLNALDPASRRLLDRYF